MDDDAEHTSEGCEPSQLYASASTAAHQLCTDTTEAGHTPLLNSVKQDDSWGQMDWERPYCSYVQQDEQMQAVLPSSIGVLVMPAVDRYGQGN